MVDVKTYTPGSVKTFACPQCGGTITIRAVGISISAICQSCGSVIDVANEELSIISKALSHTKKDLALPLGTRGQMFGYDWEVLGYAERADEDDTFSWREYLLFNPWQGFRFLVESDGHWTFVKMLRQNLDVHNIDDVNYNHQSYKIYSSYSAKVKYILGEFYWRVKIGEKADVRDYIAPPYIISKEQSDQDIIWSHGIYVRSDIVRNAFGIKEKWPSPQGIAPNQPSPGSAYFAPALKVAGIAIFCLLLFQIGLLIQNKPSILIDTTVEALPSQKDTPKTTDVFTIPERTGNLAITISSPVNNNWVEIDAELVNQVTQEEDEAIETVEYYYGSDQDGPWTEGSQVSQDVLSAVPGGQYRLLLTTDAGIFPSNQSVQYTLRVTRDISDWSNFWTAFLLLIACPAILWLYHRNFEKRRWADASVTLPGSTINARKFQ